MTCASGWTIGLFGSYYFLGHVFGTVSLSRLGDTVGRIPMMRVGLTVNVVIFGLMLYVSRNIYFHYALMIAIGMLSCLRVNLAFIYGQEICVPSQ